MLYPTFQVPQIIDTEEAASESIFLPAYSFENGDLVIDGNGASVVANETEAWKQWCLKQMMTERYEFLAYSGDIGSSLLGAAAEKNRAAQESAIERTVTETLLADPYRRTLRVDGFSHAHLGDEIRTSFIVTGKNGAAFKMSVETR